MTKILLVLKAEPCFIVSRRYRYKLSKKTDKKTVHLGATFTQSNPISKAMRVAPDSALPVINMLFADKEKVAITYL